MDDAQFLDGLKSQSEKDQEWTDNAEHLVRLKGGSEKTAYYGATPMSLGGDPAKGWLGQFEGTPLAQQALALERQELTMESEDLARRQQERQESEGRMQMDQQRWDARDQIRLQKRELELQLAAQNMDAAGGQPGPELAPAAPSESALPKPDAGVASAVAPALQGSEKLAISMDFVTRAAGNAPAGRVAQFAGRQLQRGSKLIGAAADPRAEAKGLTGYLKNRGQLRTNMGTAALLTKSAYEIQPSDRPSIAKSTFAQPNKEEAGHKGKYPIPDEQHARSALGFAKMHGDTGALAAVRAKIKQKFPHMLKEAGAMSGAANTIHNAAGNKLNPRTLIPGLIGALAMGALTHHTSKSRPELGGQSKGEISTQRMLKKQQDDGADESGMGMTHKLLRRTVEAGPGIAKIQREHPYKSTALSAASGFATGVQAAEKAGLLKTFVTDYLKNRASKDAPKVLKLLGSAA